MSIPEESLSQAVAALKRGELVIMPTDTVYGLAAAPWHADAVERIYRAKGRREDNPLPLLAADIDAVIAAGARLTAVERRLAETFWPGPLTLVLTMADPPERTEGFRVPDCEVARSLLRDMGGVLRVTSANLSGEPPALTAGDAEDALRAHVAMVLDSGPVPGGTASSVVRCRGEQIEVLRPGALSIETLSRCIESGHFEASDAGKAC